MGMGRHSTYNYKIFLARTHRQKFEFIVTTRTRIYSASTYSLSIEKKTSDFLSAFMENLYINRIFSSAL